ncbi:probable cytochrome P450 6a14 [Agrilus planipennis]|uniref:Probable cytochrome P450 6a14 n=1 Tax=Agrilus planipennis TaxID=224129 RepID=A0A7F5R6R5_AGRPL|nr:probable cytochrome P450 6a14 [Agrilus planipennis]
MIFQVIIAVIVVSVTVVILYLKWSFRYWKSRNVFTIEPTLPFGNANETISGRQSLGLSLTKLYNSAKAKGLRYAGLYFIASPVFLAIDLKLLRSMLIIDFHYFTDHTLFTNEKNDPLSAHLFTLNGAKWKALRTKLTPLFTSGKLKMMFQTLVDCTNNFPYVLDEAIKRNEPFDIKDTFARYTTDVIGSVAFGIDCNCLKDPNTEFRAIGKKTVEVGIKESLVQAAFVASPKIVDLFKLKITNSEVETFIMNIVRETIEYREKNNFARNDFMQLLMNLRHQEIKLNSSTETDDSVDQLAYYQNGLTLEEVAAQAFVFFVAGFETSSTTLNFLMYELVQNLDIQEKLREEIKTVLKRYEGKITYEAIQEMTYMEKIVNETLRKYPPLPTTTRVCTKDYKIPDSDVVIQKGTLVLVPIYAIQHDPEYYPDPEKFDPERFSEENKNKRPPLTFLPFGEGPRICIGLRMGVLQIKVGLTALLRDYKFTLNSKTKVPLQFNGRQFVLTVDGGVWIEAQKI